MILVSLQKYPLAAPIRVETASWRSVVPWCQLCELVSDVHWVVVDCHDLGSVFSTLTVNPKRGGGMVDLAKVLVIAWMASTVCTRSAR